MTLLSALGLAAGLLFAYSGLPTAFATIRAGRSLGTPLSMALSVWVGMVLMFTYITGTYGWDRWVCLDYACGIFSWSTILGYRVFRPARVVS